jgi:hypothetical protein
METLLCSLPADVYPRFVTLLHASLWGNRTDLSYMVAAHLGRPGGGRDERSNLLVDDTEKVWRFLTASDPKGFGKPFGSGTGSRLVIIADNAGTELLMDLALIDGLLADGLAGEVHLHLKPQPFDVWDGLNALEQGDEAARALAGRLRSYLVAGRLRLVTHWLYTTSLFYFQLPADLRADLATAGLVIVKGDANYRRLLGDAHWLPTTPFSQAVSYFPAPLVALRTFKSELVVGLAEGQAEWLAAEDPAWLVNGQRGVIQVCLPKRPEL